MRVRLNLINHACSTLLDFSQEKCGRLSLETGEVVKRHPQSRLWGGVVPGSLTKLTLAEYIDSHLDKLKNGGAEAR